MFRILVIDDDRTVQILLSRALGKNYEVITAGDGEEGLRIARELNPALVICDWMMPKMTGIDVCTAIKSTPQLSTTFFILLTSLDSIPDRVKGLDAGADDFLCKPIEINELRARVRAGIRLHQLSHALRSQKQLLEMELTEAAEYVKSILPEPWNEGSISIDFRFLPSRRLGGDGLDFFRLDRDTIAFYLLDVAGHGLRAALPSLSVINLLRSSSLKDVNYYLPNEVLQGLNRVFQIGDRNDKYFTIWYGVYNERQRELIYSCAGHPPAIFIALDDSGSPLETRLKTLGFPVGMFPDSVYDNRTLVLDRPGCLYLFSDGIYEIDRSDGRIWGMDNFIAALKSYHARGDRNMDDFILSIRSLQFNGNISDDMSLMAINFNL